MSKIPDIIHTAIFEAPIQKVWERVSTAEGISTWFIENDLVAEVGHEFHIQSPFGPSPCKVLKVEEPTYLSFAWDNDGWIVEFILKDLGDKTEFTLIHGGWKAADKTISKANRDAASVRETMNEGWIGIIETLKKGVEN